MTRPKASSPAAPSRPRGRPPSISDERLLDVAREVFLAHGIRATTGEVAARARVSEGTLFHRFKSKDALFRAAMRFDPEAIPQLFESLFSQAGEENLRNTLVDVGIRLVGLGRVALPVLMMSWSNPSGEYSLEKLLNKKVGFQRPQNALSGFFQGEILRGRMGNVDVQVLSRMFLGAVRDFCMTELLQPDDPSRPTASKFVEGLVDIVLRASAPDPVPARPRPRTR